MTKKSIPSTVQQIITLLEKATAPYQQPLINQLIAEFGHNPFIILIGCLLSLRAQDKTTIHACRKLFQRVSTPQELLTIPDHELESIIFTTGFYRTKRSTIQHVARQLIDMHHGTVPSSYHELIAIKGIGPKTANLVLGMAFQQPAICVDTHVHRISNRLGLLSTTSVEQTEAELRTIIPRHCWIVWNQLLVVWGQNVCTPRKPRCSSCPLTTICQKKNL